jgi:hypothetical protein
MKGKLVLGLAALAACALALQGARALYVNGKKSSKAPIVKAGETYVPLSSLKAAGAEVTVAKDRISIVFLPPAGRNERGYVEGLIGEFVSNEVWRIKFENVQEIVNPFGTGGKGYSVEMEVRNLASTVQTLHGTGLEGPRLIDSAGNSLSPADSSFPGRYQPLEPGGALRNTVKFGPTGPGVNVQAASKIVLTFRNVGKPKPYTAIRVQLQP